MSRAMIFAAVACCAILAIGAHAQDVAEATTAPKTKNDRLFRPNDKDFAPLAAKNATDDNAGLVAWQSLTADAEAAAVGAASVSVASTNLVLANEGSWGTWRSAVNCPSGTFVRGWQTRVEGRQGGGDDSALNGVRIGCAAKTAGANYQIPSHASDTQGNWGSWSAEQYCPSEGHLVGVRIRTERPQGWGDDSAMNDVEGICSKGGRISTPNTNGWGDWGSDIFCPGGQAVCGIQPKIEGSQGAGDDTAMNGLRLLCCKY